MTARAHRHVAVDQAADDLRDMIADLTRTRSHRERLATRPQAAGGPVTHFTKVPPLLAQLQMTDPTSEAGARSGSGFESRPAASLEAIDALLRIDLEASRWVRDLGEDDPGDDLEVVSRSPTPHGPACLTCHHRSCQRIRRGEIVVRRAIPGSGTAACVRLLGSLLPSANRCKGTRGHQHDGRCHDGMVELDRGVGVAGSGWCCTWHAVEHDVRRWWTQARIVTGWDRAAWCPDNTCPACGVRRSLRIRLEDRIGVCVECRETWPPDSYQVLAEHIRSESDERRAAVSVVGPCMCRWPQSLATVGLAGLCPRCGSATCEHAVRSTGRKAV